MAQAVQEPEKIISLVVDGGSSFFLPHFDRVPKCTSQKQLFEVAPYVVINNGAKTAHLYYHYTEYSQDPNFVISILWAELQRYLQKILCKEKYYIFK